MPTEGAPPHRQPHTFFVSCERGAEGALRKELLDLGIRGPKGARAGVVFHGRLTDGMRACLHARTAMRVLLELGTVAAGNADALYEGTRALDWSPWVTSGATIAVRAVGAGSEALHHSGFVALKVKDAVVDAVRAREDGARPSVAGKDPDVPISVHLEGDTARVYLDMAGEPLHRRGYRVAMTEAPLKETLAAAILLLAGVPSDARLADPMCGSGTFVIEQALRARGRAPGLLRRFAFERWPRRELISAWPELRAEAESAAAPRAPLPLIARDHDPAAIEAARRNAAAAGVADDIRFEVGPLRTFAPGAPAGWVCSNPPYGERLEPTPPPRGRPVAPTPGARPLPPPPSAALLRLYDEWARVAHAALWGWHVVLLAAQPALPRAMGMPFSISHRLSNGGLDVRLLRYDLTG